MVEREGKGGGGAGLYGTALGGGTRARFIKKSGHEKKERTQESNNGARSIAFAFAVAFAVAFAFFAFTLILVLPFIFIFSIASIFKFASHLTFIHICS